MKKLKTFLIFVVLVAIWAAFFATIKFYLWGELGDSLKPDLQKIAGYLSLGSVFAFIVGGAFASTFLKKYYLFIISIFSFLFISMGYFVGFHTNLFFALIVTLIGFLYGLWNVVKSVIIAIEIKKTGLPETLVNAIVGITFVIFIIIGSIIGSILFEKMGHSGYLVIMGLLFFASVLSLYLDYDNVKFVSLLKKGWGNYVFERKETFLVALKNYIPDLKYIIKNYFFIIITSAFLWTISTIVSQASVEYSEKTFMIIKSKASFVLLYSALGAIVGNLLSVKMNVSRWKFFIIFNTLFSLVIIVFPFLAVNFAVLSFLALILGMFFGVSSNLVDSFLLKTIGDEDKKEYGASTFGLVFSIILFSMMFLSSLTLKIYGYKALMIILGVISFVVGLSLFFKQIKINK